MNIPLVVGSVLAWLWLRPKPPVPSSQGGAGASGGGSAGSNPLGLPATLAGGSTAVLPGLGLVQSVAPSTGISAQQPAPVPVVKPAIVSPTPRATIAPPGAIAAPVPDPVGVQTIVRNPVVPATPPGFAPPNVVPASVPSYCKNPRTPPAGSYVLLPPGTPGARTAIVSREFLAPPYLSHVDGWDILGMMGITGPDQVQISWCAYPSPEWSALCAAWGRPADA